jgi:acyl carrier protein
MESELNSKLQSVMQQVFGDPALVLNDAMTADDIEGWDSLAHVNLVIAIEKRFGIKFAMAEIAALKEPGQNIGTFKQLIAKKVGASA